MKSINRHRSLLGLVCVVAAALVVAGCDTATSMSGVGTFPSGPGTGQLQLNYRVLQPQTGSGLMSGSYNDPAHAVGLTFAYAPSDACVPTYGVSCTTYVKQECSAPGADGYASYATCVVANADNDCADTLFNYLGTLSHGRGQGTLEVCSDPAWFDIDIHSGPYAGYTNESDLTGRLLSGGGL